jgi:hypothetical protein
MTTRRGEDACAKAQTAVRIQAPIIADGMNPAYGDPRSSV